jgi:uncharacterized protein YndB with AHSA1/START domain
MSVMIDRPVEEVWKFITDLSNVPKWETAVLEVKRTSAGPVGVGSTWELKRKDNWTLPQRCIEFEPNRKLCFVITSGPAEGTVVTYSMETVEGKTKLTSGGDFKFNGLYRLLGPFVTRGQRREIIASIGNLKSILESEAK